MKLFSCILLLIVRLMRGIVKQLSNNNLILELNFKFANMYDSILVLFIVLLFCLF
jgi:hypothetical protein